VPSAPAGLLASPQARQAGGAIYAANCAIKFEAAAMVGCKIGWKSFSRHSQWSARHRHASLAKSYRSADLERHRLYRFA